MADRFQFSLSGMLLLTALFALACTLGQWVGPHMAVIITVLPFVAIAERVFTRSTVETIPGKRHYSGFEILALAVCAASTACAANLSVSNNVPEVHSPFAMLVIVPYFLIDDLIWPFVSQDSVGMHFRTSVSVIPVAWFASLNLDYLRGYPASKLPVRFVMLLGVATLGSAVWLTAGWESALEYQSMNYALTVCIANAVFLILLWFCWVIAYRKNTFMRRLTFVTLLHFWLFYLAFPWMGELP